MARQKVWNSIEDIFDALNSRGCNYLVMRNYECFKSGQVFMNGHDDIDLLCDDIKLVQRVLDTRRRFIFPTVNSYYIRFNELVVCVDIRFVGDGYYDAAWQLDMLKNRTSTEQRIYVMDPINYFYSLIYHAAFHKYVLSDDYLKKLANMARGLALECTTEEVLLKALFQYMEENQYEMTITRDPGVILNFSGVGSQNIRPRYFWLIKRKILNTLKRFKRIGDKFV